MEQGLLFDFPQFKITKKIRLIELFGGIGSQAMALRDIGADFEHYRLVEFDKYAVASYNSIHGTSFETADIRNVHGADLGITERDKFTYIMTYSFPCTDLSIAGKMQGMSKAEWENGNSTRSGLLWEVERILKELRAEELPQVLLMENVPQVHADQNYNDFESWLAFLRSKGYYNFYQDLNAKDYGIPQNRERCFCVSILSPEFIEYEFPEHVKLQTVMRDYLEDQVDEKYYNKSEKADKLIRELIERKELLVETKTQSKQVVVIGQMDNTIDHTFESANRVYDKNQLCPTIPTCAGGNIQPKIIEETKCIGGLSDSQWGTQYHQQDRVYKGEIALAQPATLPHGSYKYLLKEKEQYRIRRLTPKECWRLMGYTDEDFEKAHNAGVSNSQLYKQAGNAIVKQVLMAIFSQML